MAEDCLCAVGCVAAVALMALSCAVPEPPGGKAAPAGPRGIPSAGTPGRRGDRAEPPAEAAPAADTASERPAAPAEGCCAYRWVFSFGYGRTREGVDSIRSLVATAADHGLNGIVLSSFGLDSITRWPRKDLDLLREVSEFCREKAIELIPTGFSVGYGGGALGHDRNLAAALPVTMSLLARGGRAVPVVPEANLIKNGDLEEHRENRFAQFAFHDRPGETSFADGEVVSSGTAAIRFENLHLSPHGHGRIMQVVAVRPGRPYRFTCRIRTRDLDPTSGLQVLVLKEKGQVASVRPRVEPTSDWTEVTLDFINYREKELRVYAGIWGGKSGTFWLDDLRMYEYASLADIVRRDGTPLELRSTDRQMTFVEGKDFAGIRNQRDLEHVTLTPGTAIVEGERLELSCYKTPFVGHSWGRQISLCMSTPALYECWEKEARALHEVLGFKKFLLSMDEIRNGGGCLACSRRGLSMGEILGDCVTKQYRIFKRIDPGIEVLIWSDMLDPNHNAHDNYYGVVGDFTGSWKHVPRDLVIACWYHRIRDKSLRFFSEQGFRTLGASYYDANDLQNPTEWLASLRHTERAVGIMYTSWRRKYELLGAFGDLVSGK